MTVVKIEDSEKSVCDFISAHSIYAAKFAVPDTTPGAWLCTTTTGEVLTSDECQRRW